MRDTAYFTTRSTAFSGATAIGGPYVKPHSYVISKILSVSYPMAA